MNKKNYDPGRLLMKILTPVLLALITSSCSTSGKSDPSTHVVPAISRAWVKVSSKPPIWYPRGVPANHPTDYKSGAWIRAEDSLNTRFFIPIHGLPPERRKALEEEALAARHPDTIRRNQNKEIARKTKAVGSMILMTPYLVLMNYE